MKAPSRKDNRIQRRPWSLAARMKLLIGLIGTSLVVPLACDPTTPDEVGFRSSETDFVQPADPELFEDVRGNVVYSYTRFYESTEADEPFEVLEEGEITNEILQRVGRPYSFMDEPYVYHMEAWHNVQEDGSVVKGYRVWRKENDAPPPAALVWEVPYIDESLQPLLEDGLADDGSDTLQVNITLRNFPEWDVPLLPDTSMVAVEDLQAAYDEREDALAARTQVFDEMAGEIIADIEAHGGSVVKRGSRHGFIIANVSAEGLAVLATRTDIVRISDGRYLSVDAAWNLGEGRQDARMDADRFLAAGYTGEQPNSGRHSFNDITVAIIEKYGFEDEACFFQDSAGCSGTSRIQERLSRPLIYRTPNA